MSAIKSSRRVRYTNIYAADSPEFRGLYQSQFRSATKLLPGSEIVLLCRVSRRHQEKANNLADQVRAGKLEAKLRGWMVVGVVSYVGSGWDLDGEVEKAYYRALRILEDHPGAVLVVETVDRALRPSAYTSKHQDAPLRVRDLRLLRVLAACQPIYVRSNPGATPGENRSVQTKRGMKMKGSKHGRPIQRRDSYRAKWLPVALELRSKGYGYKRIAKEITRRASRPLSRMGVKKWLTLGVNLKAKGKLSSAREKGSSPRKQGGSRAAARKRKG
jgi:hypothetical protein